MPTLILISFLSYLWAQMFHIKTLFRSPSFKKRNKIYIYFSFLKTLEINRILTDRNPKWSNTSGKQFHPDQSMALRSFPTFDLIALLLGN